MKKKKSKVVGEGVGNVYISYYMAEWKKNLNFPSLFWMEDLLAADEDAWRRCVQMKSGRG